MSTRQPAEQITDSPTRAGNALARVIAGWRARRRRMYVLDLFRRMGNERVHIGYTPEQAEREIFGDVIGFKA